jgi:2-methylcitrate dehydratase PrpD
VRQRRLYTVSDVDRRDGVQFRERSQILDTSEVTRVAHWGANLAPTELAAPSISSVRRIFLDDLAAMIAGHRDREVQTVLDGWPVLDGPSTVFAPTAPTAHPWSAAELNGLAGCWLEVDGGFRLNTAHAGLYTIPAVVAVAEERDLTLGEAFAAMTVGYEVAARIVTRWDVKGAGSHAHGSIAAVAAAAAAGRALGVSPEHWASAVSSAATLSAAAPFGHASSGAVVRNLWAASGARVGLMAVHAATRGVGGLDTSIDDTYGEVFSCPRWTGQPLPDELGTAVQFAYQKSYACCAFLHSAVEATLGLLADQHVTPEQVVAITARLHPVALPLDDPAPTTTLGARFSAPHAIAATLMHGAADPRSFDLDSVADPTIDALRSKVTLAPIERAGRDESLRDAEVELVLDDGRTLTRYVDVAIGDPARPLSDQQLIDKATALVGWDAAPLAELLLSGGLDLPFAEVTRLVRTRIA